MTEYPKSASKRGIYLVANRRSAEQCNNLIYSIRRCGCQLPIRVIPYGGDPFVLDRADDNVRIVSLDEFPPEGMAFVNRLATLMPDCSPGHLRRFLCWFGEFDEFLYSDNDIVALMNWEEMFLHLQDYELVHADEEYTTKGKYNLLQPERFEQLLGPGAIDQAFTAGHFLCRRKPQHIDDLSAAADWMQAHPGVVKGHDQALLHVTLVLRQWPELNLCKPPYNFVSSWAYHYGNTLELLALIQAERRSISHVHYSGYNPAGEKPIEELLFSNLPAKARNRKLLQALARDASGLMAAQSFLGRVKRKLRRMAGQQRPKSSEQIAAPNEQDIKI